MADLKYALKGAGTRLPKRKRGRPPKNTTDTAALADTFQLAEESASPILQRILTSSDHQGTFNMGGLAEEEENREEPCSSNFYVEGPEDSEFIECKPRFDLVGVEGVEGQTVFPEQGAEYVAECESNAWPDALEHYRTNTGDRPYECSKCPKTFSALSNLRNHERTHTGELPYTCKVCLKTYSHMSGLHTFECIHTGEKSHGCSFCTKMFSTQTALKKHIRLHTGKKPFPCRYCPMHFTEGSKRNLHERQEHTNERTVKCTMCKEMFLDFEQQARHIAEIHGDSYT